LDAHTDITLSATADISGLISIADQLFGQGYLNQKDFQSYIDDDAKTCLVARTNGTISGFQLIQTCSPNQIMEIALSEEDWFTQQFAKKRSIGVLKSIAVSREFKKNGIGTLLTKQSIKLIQKTSKEIISICWEQKGDTPILAILEKCGMRLIHEIDEFWKIDSLIKKYNCQICGPPPCRCRGLIYQYSGTD
jgi:ribosomal protein S18 acetylase RimI-like enzyme